MLEVERALIGVRSEPFHIRAQEIGFEPDAPDAYCWRCGTSVGPSEADGVGCAACRRRRLAWSRCVRVGDYQGELRRAILEVKFTRFARLGFELGELLGDRVVERMRRYDVDPRASVVVPVPMSFRRRTSRGIDHTLAIARGVRSRTRGRLVRALRRRHGASQLEVPMSGRKANVSGVFSPGRALPEECGVVVVVDDVRTTGATMSAACRAVRKGWRERGLSASDLELWSGVVGVTPGPERRVNRLGERVGAG